MRTLPRTTRRHSPLLHGLSASSYLARKTLSVLAICGAALGTAGAEQQPSQLMPLLCLERPTKPVVVPGPTTNEPLELKPDPSTVLDLRGVRLLAEPPLNPLVIEHADGDVCVVGPTVIGRASRDAGWYEIKHEHDGDGVRFANATGKFTLEGAHIENVADAVAPPKAPNTPRAAAFAVRGVYACYIRDDFIENDAALGGEVSDTLVDGTHVFISARPGRGFRESREKFPPATLSVRDSLVRLDCKPDDRADGQDAPTVTERAGGACGIARSLGMPFKWSAAAENLRLDMADTIIRVDAAGRNGPRSMNFPPGTYRDVTLIWLGSGPYPGTLPETGVSVTTDQMVWDTARAAWLRRHGYTAGEHCATR